MIYKIGDCYLDCNIEDFNINDQGFIKRFESDRKDGDSIQFRFEYKNLDYIKDYKMIYYSLVSEFYQLEDDRFVVCHWARCRFAIGFKMKDLDKDVIPIYIHPKLKEEIPISANRLISLIGLHRVLLKKDAVVLHASYIDYNGKAILFTAPSQTGKSTQSKLWEQYENAMIINDDRVLIRKKDNVWNAYGYPACGSSGVCINRTLPICSIVVLEQGTENKIVELTYSEKIKAIVLGIEVYPINKDEIDLSFTLADKMVNDVKMFKLVCLPNQNAVDVLKEYLRKDDVCA